MKNNHEDRKARNRELVARMKAGESMALIDRQATWWPRHAPIHKDKEAMEKLEKLEKLGKRASEAAA